MRFIDASDVPSGSTIHADICIVGSGVAGITLAARLDGTGYNVCLVEGGSLGPDESSQALYDLEVAGHPVRQDFMSRARYFGGTSNLWAGRAMRLSPLDLRRRDWVPDSGWPIAYAELDRYYQTATALLRLPSWDTLDVLCGESRMHPVERALLDDSDLRPNLSLWAKEPLRFGGAYRRQLRDSRNVAVYLNANVIAIEVNHGGTGVEACTARTLGGRALRFTAARFVLACGGLETARLLLASRGVMPQGVGNDHDTVGRYYMDHPRAVYGRVRFTTPQKLRGLLGVPLAAGMGQLGIQFSDEIQEREQLLNGYVTLERQWSDQTARAYQSFVHTAKIVLRKGYAGSRFSLARERLAKVPELIYLLAPRELLPHPLYRAARLLKDSLSAGATDLIVVNYCEQPPNAQSRVYLGSDRDQLGVPRLVLDWVIGRRETETLMRLHELLDRALRRMGAGHLSHLPAESGALHYTDASHHLGTTRMSADPRLGVVDADCRVHGIANLFIAGSGVFPTAGHANPTLTIVALAVRLAEHLARAAV